MIELRKLFISSIVAALLFSGETYAAVNACQQTRQLSGGRTIYNKNEVGNGNGNYKYEIWRDGNGGSLTLYPKNAAFKASWNNAGDFLGRVGLTFNKPSATNLGGDLVANYAYKKTGSDGGTYSYIGVYGWMDNPKIEYYVVDDWMHNRGPPGGSYIGAQKGTIKVDGGIYKVWSGQRTGPSKWGTTTFTQIFSIRTSARQCGSINVSEHFRQWQRLGLRLGGLMEAQILAESGGGSGSVDFTYATVQIERKASSNSNSNTNKNNNNNKNNNKNNSKNNNNNNKNKNNNKSNNKNNNKNNTKNKNTNKNKNTKNCAARLAQCGGNGFNGPKCCSQGTCKKINIWYSQCQ